VLSGTLQVHPCTLASAILPSDAPPSPSWTLTPGFVAILGPFSMNGLAKEKSAGFPSGFRC
jgi:hypothetical protein